MTPWDLKISKAYESLGRFLSEFEACCEQIKTNIIFALIANGLSNEQMARIMVNDLSASQLGNVYSALIHESIELNDDMRRVIGGFRKRFKELCEERNNHIHASWHIDGNVFDEEPIISRWRHKTSSDGNNFLEPHMSLESIEKLIGVARELWHYTNAMGVCFDKNIRTDLGLHFSVSRSGVEVVSSSVRREAEWHHSVPKGRSTGIKGSIDRKLIFVARNLNDFWSLAFEDHEQAPWAHTAFAAVIEKIPEQLRNLELGRVALFSERGWKIVDSQFRPEPHEALPDFRAILLRSNQQIQ